MDAEHLGRDMLAAVIAYVARETAPLAARVQELESRVAEKGDAGPVGEQGASGEAGDGIASVGITQGTDERDFTITVMQSSGVKTESTFHLPVIIYRQVWRDGEYTQGDVVTHSGSAWHCQLERTTDKPGTSEAWRLMVKTGR